MHPIQGVLANDQEVRVATFTKSSKKLASVEFVWLWSHTSEASSEARPVALPLWRGACAQVQQAERVVDNPTSDHRNSKAPLNLPNVEHASPHVYHPTRAMPSIRSPWSVIISYLATFCGGLLRRDQIAKDGISRPDPPTPSKKEHASSNDQRNAAGRASDEPSSHFPLAEQQVEHAIAHFIASINRQAVCDLVSRYNGGAKCKILDNDNSSHGSFNVCFFVRVAGAASAGSDAAIQILRMPIRPVVVSGWEKVLSEITTMQ